MNIVLIGMRGSGKTTISKILSDLLNRKIVSIDKSIENKSGMKISEIVEIFGWKKFRDLETSALLRVSKLNNAIIDCGGGIVVREENINLLRNKSILIWLEASVKTLLARIGKGSNRPYLTSAKNRAEDVVNILEERKKLYMNAADFIIKTDDKKPEKIAREIIEFFNHYDRLKN